MALSPSTETNADTENGKCLARSVTEVLAKEPALEAVTVNQTDGEMISRGHVGAGGCPQNHRSKSRPTIQNAQASVDGPCALLSGEGDLQCLQLCRSPAKERKTITIRSEGNTTTIARLTCPTAPAFLALA